jgi:hypothetical protein
VRLAGWADAYYLLLAPHNVCDPVGTEGQFAPGGGDAELEVLEHFNDFADSWVLDLVNEPPRIDTSDGCFTLPDRPASASSSITRPARHTLAREAASNCSKQAGSIAASVLRGQGVRAV